VTADWHGPRKSCLSDVRPAVARTAAPRMPSLSHRSRVSDHSGTALDGLRRGVFVQGGVFVQSSLTPSRFCQNQLCSLGATRWESPSAGRGAPRPQACRAYFFAKLKGGYPAPSRRFLKIMQEYTSARRAVSHLSGPEIFAPLPPSGAPSRMTQGTFSKIMASCTSACSAVLQTNRGQNCYAPDRNLQNLPKNTCEMHAVLPGCGRGISAPLPPAANLGTDSAA
jgi:hypothetical protein